MRSTPQPHHRLPRSEWTGAEAAIHVLRLLVLFESMAGGGRSPYEGPLTEFGAVSRRLIDEYPHRDIRVLCHELERAGESLLRATDSLPGTTPFHWHGLAWIPLSHALAILVGEFELHGYDIAVAGRQPWVVRGDNARMVLAAIQPLMPLVVTPEAAGLRVTYELRIRGLAPLLLHFDDGLLTTALGPGPADCRLGGDPVAMMMVTYGRWSQLHAIARGRLYAWGRRPWLGTRLTQLLRTP